MSIGLSLDSHGSYLQVDLLLLHRAIKLDIDRSDEHVYCRFRTITRVISQTTTLNTRRSCLSTHLIPNSLFYRPMDTLYIQDRPVHLKPPGEWLVSRKIA